MILQETLDGTIPLIKPRTATPEEVDATICQEIDNLTAENNQIWTSPDHDRREYVHSFFQYPAMMVPVVQKKLIEIIVNSKPGISNVLDAFMGSGTSLVACMENGLNCFGQDINPLAVLVTKARTGPFFFAAIKNKKATFFQLIQNDNSKNIEAKFKGIKKWFKTSVIWELSAIVRAIKQEENAAIRRFYWVILAESIRLSSNDRTSTFKLHARSVEEIKNRNVSPIEVFLKHFQKCLDDLEEYAELLKESNRLSKGHYTGNCVLHLKDSKNEIYTPNNVGCFYDLHVTSPPYGDNKTTVTYGQYSYLPLQWIDFEDIDGGVSKETFLSSTSQIDTLGLGGRLSNIVNKNLEILYQASPTLKTIIEQINTINPGRSRKVMAFFLDIYKSIENIHHAMKINSYQVWTVGNRTVAGIEIPNDIIMADFIQHHGSILVKTISRKILNRRMAKKNSSSTLMTFEDILIFRKIA